MDIHDATRYTAYLCIILEFMVHCKQLCWTKHYRCPCPLSGLHCWLCTLHPSSHPLQPDDAPVNLLSAGRACSSRELFHRPAAPEDSEARAAHCHEDNRDG
jgi:hypothetical protein